MGEADEWPWAPPEWACIHKVDVKTPVTDDSGGCDTTTQLSPADAKGGEARGGLDIGNLADAGIQAVDANDLPGAREALVDIKEQWEK